MVSNLGALRSMSFSMLSSVSSGGRAYLPVSPSQYVYSQFQYVAGVPAPEGSSGVPLTKLKILNTILDQLVTMQSTKADGERLRGSVSLPEGMSDEQISALIEQYRNELQTAAEASGNALYKPPLPETGLIFRVNA